MYISSNNLDSQEQFAIYNVFLYLVLISFCPHLHILRSRVILLTLAASTVHVVTRGT